MAKKVTELAVQPLLERVEKENLPFEQLVAQLNAENAIVPVAALRDNLGEKWVVCEDKDMMVGVAFVIVDWTFREGEYGDYVSLNVVTANQQRLILNDGSTGLCEQVRGIAAAGELRAIYCPKGLTKSKDYTYTDANGEKRKGQPIYRLNLS